jgi:hypothetical protein
LCSCTLQTLHLGLRKILQGWLKTRKAPMSKGLVRTIVLRIVSFGQESGDAHLAGSWSRMFSNDPSATFRQLHAFRCWSNAVRRFTHRQKVNAAGGKDIGFDLVQYPRRMLSSMRPQTSNSIVSGVGIQGRRLAVGSTSGGAALELAPIPQKRGFGKERSVLRMAISMKRVNRVQTSRTTEACSVSPINGLL